MGHMELHVGIRLLIIGVALAFIFVPMVWGKAPRNASALRLSAFGQ